MHRMISAFVLAMSIGVQPSIQLGTGPKMCAALTPDDFKRVGLTPDPAPPRPPSSDDKTSAYCTYTKAFPVAGGLELDIFDGEDDPAGVMKTILAEGRKPKPAGLQGVDESALTLSPGEKGHTVASLVVRHRRLVFAISAPSGPKANAQLAALARLVLSRVTH
jgi:hypothetical protein